MCTSRIINRNSSSAAGSYNIAATLFGHIDYHHLLRYTIVSRAKGLGATNPVLTSVQYS